MAMHSFNLDNFIDDKSLGEIIDIFNDAYSIVTESALELVDITYNREQIEKQEQGSIENAERTMKYFYENSYDALVKAFHRIVGLFLFKNDSDNEDMRTFYLTKKTKERYNIPFDTINEQPIEGFITFTIGDNVYDDDELSVTQMKKVVDMLVEEY